MEAYLVVITHVFVCIVTAVVVVYVPSIISSTHSKVYGRVACTFSPSGMMLFYPVTMGWNFTSAYVIILSINIRRHIERRNVNQEEFCE